MKEAVPITFGSRCRRAELFLFFRRHGRILIGRRASDWKTKPPHAVVLGRKAAACGGFSCQGSTLTRGSSSNPFSFDSI